MSSPLPDLDRRLCVAPMMDWTDRHCRYFLRLVSRNALLYTEMITSAAIVRGDGQRLLAHDPQERPVALQLGGSDPAEMARAAGAGEAAGYDEININVGCPSGRVQAGEFGACLMKKPARVAECFRAMAETVQIPVTVKTRLGVDDLDSYEFLADFVGTLAEAGCRIFVVHARKALLSGLSPRENREVPPLDYERAYRLKRDFSALEVVINGGIRSVEHARQHREHVDGVMIGRAAYHDSYMLAELDQSLNSDYAIPSRAEIVDAFLPYVARQLSRGVPLQAMTRHTLGLFQGRPGARAYRRFLSENARFKDAGVDVLERALGTIQNAA